MRVTARSRLWAFLTLLGLVALGQSWSRSLPTHGGAAGPAAAFPLKPGSVRFAVIGIVAPAIPIKTTWLSKWFVREPDSHSILS